MSSWVEIRRWERNPSVYVRTFFSSGWDFSKTKVSNGAFNETLTKVKDGDESINQS